MENTIEICATATDLTPSFSRQTVVNQPISVLFNPTFGAWIGITHAHSTVRNQRWNSLHKINRLISYWRDPIGEYQLSYYSHAFFEKLNTDI